MIDKRDGELQHWKREISNYVEWYTGKRKELWGCPCPTEEQIKESINVDSFRLLEENAMDIWLHVWQMKKYLFDLDISPDEYVDMSVCDIGCGPMPNIFCFNNCKEYHGIDPLCDGYKRAGYPLDNWSRDGMIYHSVPAEETKLPDNSFDVIISVNAIDHVDNFGNTAKEIKRIMKPDGKFRMHVHYHKATMLEPIELNDLVFMNHFGWVPGLKKIWQRNSKDMGKYTAPEGESFVLWGN